MLGFNSRSGCLIVQKESSAMVYISNERQRRNTVMAAGKYAGIKGIRRQA
jgi:hypothetical protein